MVGGKMTRDVRGADSIHFWWLDKSLDIKPQHPPPSPDQPPFFQGSGHIWISNSVARILGNKPNGVVSGYSDFLGHLPFILQFLPLPPFNGYRIRCRKDSWNASSFVNKSLFSDVNRDKSAFLLCDLNEVGLFLRFLAYGGGGVCIMLCRFILNIWNALLFLVLGGFTLDLLMGTSYVNVTSKNTFVCEVYNFYGFLYDTL